MRTRQIATRSATPVVHYVQPSLPAGAVLLYDPHQLAEQQRQRQLLLARWRQRQAEIAARDRKMRSFWLGLGAVVGLVVLAALAVAGWMVYQALASVTAVLVVAAVAVLVVPAVVAVGHRCVTVIQHWH